MKPKIFQYIALLWVGQLSAQLNESDSLRFQLNLNSRGLYQEGNIKLLRLMQEVEAVIRPAKKLVFKSQNNWMYQEIFGFKADNDLLSRNYLYLSPEKKWYPYLIGFVSTNFRRAVDLRYFYGGGLTLQVIQKPRHSLKLSSNIIWESNAFTGNQYNLTEFNGVEEINTWRSTVYLSGLHSFGESAHSVFYVLYWQPSWESSANYRISLSAGLDLRLIKGLYAQTRAQYSHENLVISTVKQQDLLWLWGLSYKFRS